MPTPPRPRARLAASVAALLAVVALSPAAIAAPPKFPWQGPAVRVKPGRVIVTFAPGTTRAERQASTRRWVATTAPAARSGRRRRGPVRLSTNAAILQYRSDPSVVAAEPDRFAMLTEIPNGRHFDPHQWALHNTGQSHRISESGFVRQGSARGLNDRDVDAPAAWDADAATPGDDVAVVAVLDNGVDIDHPDLVDALWTNEIELGATPNVDDDDNGYEDDVHGWDFKQDDRRPLTAEPRGHRQLPRHARRRDRCGHPRQHDRCGGHLRRVPDRTAALRSVAGSGDRGDRVRRRERGGRDQHELREPDVVGRRARGDRGGG